MRVADVDVTIIHKLLKSVPEGMQIESIDLTNGYSLKLTAGLEEVHAVEKEIALNELQSIINQYKQIDDKCKLQNGKKQLVRR